MINIMFIFFILFFLLYSPICGAIPNADLNKLGQGLEYYHQGQYQQANEMFQSLLNAYPNNASLLFNLGLTQYQLGHRSMALGLWHKAFYQNPYLTKASQAIDFAQKQLKVPISPITYKERFQKWLPFSWDIYFFLIALAGFVFMWFKIQYLSEVFFNKTTLLDAVPTHLIVLSLVFILVTLLTLFKVRDYTTLKAIVISDQVDMQVAPSYDTASFFTLAEGSNVVIKQTRNDWTQVSYLEVQERQQVGWVLKKNIFHYAGERLW